MHRAWLLAAAPLVLSCNGTTGYELVNFYAAARGPSDAVKGQPYTFDLDGQKVTLTKATIHVGAIYLTQSVPQSGGGPAPCVLPGTYDGVFVGEVRGGGDVDLLDPAPHALAVTGQGSTVSAATGQVWLMHADVNDAVDPLPAVTLEGSVVSGGATITFSGGLTLNFSKSATSTNTGGLPGSAQICLDRIVQGIPAHLTLAQGGTLVLVVDPKALLAGAIFPTQSTSIELSGNATDMGANQPSRNLFDNVRGTGPYRFEWLPPSP
jgi:hypothetical protein